MVTEVVVDVHTTDCQPTAKVNFLELKRPDVQAGGRMTMPSGIGPGSGIMTQASIYHYSTPKKYAGIHQHHFGLLSPDSPVDGLCTFNVASCLAFVVHCSDTSRSSLTHTPTFVESWDCFKERLNK